MALVTNSSVFVLVEYPSRHPENCLFLLSKTYFLDQSNMYLCLKTEALTLRAERFGEFLNIVYSVVAEKLEASSAIWLVDDLTQDGTVTSAPVFKMKQILFWIP